MRWYDHLYVGERANERRHRIIEGIRENRLQPEVYVITSPACGHHILDMWPSVMLLRPVWREEDFLILGIAVTYWEALEVVRQIIDDMYQKTGGFCLEEFLAGS